MRFCEHNNMAEACPRCQEIISSARAAVIEKAEAWVTWAEGFRIELRNPEGRALVEAVRSYRALQKPEGKRPDQLELGSLFRFADQRDGNVWRLVTVEGSGGSLLYMEPGGASMLHRFFADDLVIPIPEPKE